MKNLYEVLQLSPGASDEAIKQAYRRLAKLYHPDGQGGDPAKAEQFKEIAEAYEVLSDPVKRQVYHLKVQWWANHPPSSAPTSPHSARKAQTYEEYLRKKAAETPNKREQEIWRRKKEVAGAIVQLPLFLLFSSILFINDELTIAGMSIFSAFFTSLVVMGLIGLGWAVYQLQKLRRLEAKSHGQLIRESIQNMVSDWKQRFL